MSKTPLYVAGVIFGLVSLVHLYRLYSHFNLVIGDTAVPNTASIAGAIIFGALSLWMFASTCCSRNQCCK